MAKEVKDSIYEGLRQIFVSVFPGFQRAIVRSSIALISGEPPRLQFSFFDINRRMNIAHARREIIEKNLRPVTLDELCEFAKRHLGAQLRRRIIGIGSIVEMGDDKGYPYLSKNSDNKPGVYFWDESKPLEPGMAVLVVPKNA